MTKKEERNKKWGNRLSIDSVKMQTLYTGSCCDDGSDGLVLSSHVEWQKYFQCEYWFWVGKKCSITDRVGYNSLRFFTLSLTHIHSYTIPSLQSPLNEELAEKGGGEERTKNWQYSTARMRERERLAKGTKSLVKGKERERESLDRLNGRPVDR